MKCFNSEMDALGSIPQEPMVIGRYWNFYELLNVRPYLLSLLSEIPFLESNFL
jgi:hypothetical protein